MSNHHLKNKALSLKAKGLLSLMLSLPDDWDYTMKGLAVISAEGIDAIRQALAELEKHHYVVRARVRDDKGCLRGAEYVIHEQPLAETVPGDPIPENPALENPILDNPTLENPALDSPTLANPMQLNTKEKNTNLIKEKAAANPNQSNPYPSSQQAATGNAHTRKQMRNDEMDGFAAAVFHRESIHKRIGYDQLIHDSRISKGRLDEMVDIMVEVLCATNDTMIISGCKQPTTLVQERLLKINSLHIPYVFYCLDKNPNKVRNIKKYLLTVLFNAPSTIENFYASMVNNNFGGLVPDDF